MQVVDLQKKSEDFLKEIKSISKRKLAEAKANEIIQNYRGDDEVVAFQNIYDEVKTEEPIRLISTGYSKLDKCFGGGVSAGQLIVVSGYSSSGKTSYCFDITRNMESENVLWLPYEETSEEFARKLIRWKKDPIKFYTPKKMNESIEWIEERILEAVLKYDTKVVFIDNLHFITMQEKQDFNRVGVFCKQLKQIAQKLGVAIFLIAHVRKSTEGMHKMPSYEDISGSSDIAKIANKIITVWRECTRELNGQLKFTNYTKVVVQKVREPDGIYDTVTFSFDKGVYREVEMDSFIDDFRKKKDF